MGQTPATNDRHSERIVSNGSGLARGTQIYNRTEAIAARALVQFSRRSVVFTQPAQAVNNPTQNVSLASVNLPFQAPPPALPAEQFAALQTPSPAVQTAIQPVIQVLAQVLPTPLPLQAPNVNNPGQNANVGGVAMPVPVPALIRGEQLPGRPIRTPAKRYNCYLCDHVCLGVSYIVNHMVIKHGIRRDQVDRRRIEATMVVCRW